MKFDINRQQDIINGLENENNSLRATLKEKQLGKQKFE